MDYLVQGFKEALNLLIRFDKDVYQVIILSLFVSSTSTIIASVFAIPLGLLIGPKKFIFKSLFSKIVFSLMSVPSVIVGLVVAMFISRRGPLGFLEFMYTPKAMIMAQAILVFPLIFGLSYNLAKLRGREIEVLGKTLGASKFQILILTIRELKNEIMVNIITGFSRAISEVGAVMLVGGNIKGQTRVITTSIAMLNSMGDYPLAIALGLVLLFISFGINILVYSWEDE